MLKKVLREYLRQHGEEEEELRSWFEPLEFQESTPEKGVTVLLPHAFFRSWLAARGQEALLAALKVCAPDKQVSIHVPPGFSPARPPVFPRVPVETAPRCRFDNFVTNAKNAFPFSIAQQIAAGEHPRYNPFVLCGKDGTGKSHLLRAMEHSLGNQFPRDTIFAAGATRLNAEDTLPGSLFFWQHYRVLLIDDLQALPPVTQDWLFRIIESHPRNGCQMAFACTGKLSSAKNLTPGLCARLEAGLVVELKEPDMDVRLRFIRRWSKTNELQLQQEQIMLLAQRCRGIRQLQGMLLKIAAFCTINRRDASLQDVDDIIRSSSDQREFTHESIISVVAAYYELPQRDFTSGRRYPRLVPARQLCMYLCRELLGLPYASVGQIFNGLDHSTVMYSIKKIKQMLDSDKAFNKTVTFLRQKCTQSTG